jgi:hypothetical protein
VAGAKPTPDPSRVRSPPVPAGSPRSPLDIPEADWSEAVRWEATVPTLAASGVNDRPVIHSAAASLGLSTARIYQLMARLRRQLP